ncbi:hypothetical protein LMG667_03425 [Xanthomonas euvesicatoria]|uniref:hypothetical protein n=1 Tax=Xanthomonas euvesicatoria TaxID=456327 RepID=UPI00080E8968|nr:hypothetical protein [Xanthomonas euvesicatoria]OCG90034.1 hypothetical protein LMG667_03425 [Xanthomonas euvesicatoria]
MSHLGFSNSTALQAHLLATVRRLLPLAESRAEDMDDDADESAEATVLARRACGVVDAAHELLTELKHLARDLAWEPRPGDHVWYPGDGYTPSGHYVVMPVVAASPANQGRVDISPAFERRQVIKVLPSEIELLVRPVAGDLGRPTLTAQPVTEPNGPSRFTASMRDDDDSIAIEIGDSVIKLQRVNDDLLVTRHDKGREDHAINSFHVGEPFGDSIGVRP